MESKWSRFQREFNIDLKDEVSDEVDLSNYYTKSEIDSLVDGIESGGVDLTNYYTKTQSDTIFNGLDSRVLDLETAVDNFHTKEEISGLLASKADTTDLANFYTKTQTDTLISGLDTRLDTAEATLTGIDSDISAIEQSLSGKAEISSLADYNTKAEISSLLSAKVDTAALSNYYTASQTDVELAKKFDTASISSYYTKTETDNISHGRVRTQEELQAALAVGGVITVDSRSEITLTSQMQVAVDGTQIIGGRFKKETGRAFLVTASDVVFSGVTITGGRVGNATYDSTQALIYCQGTSSSRLSNILIENCTFLDSRAHNVWLEWCVDSIVSGSRVFRFLYSGVMVISGLRIQVNNNRIRDAALSSGVVNVYGIAFTDSDNTVAARSVDCQAVGNMVSYIDWEGIDTHGGSGITITGNTVIGCPRGIALVTGNETRVTSPERCVVSGNNVDGTGVRQAIREGIFIAGISGKPADAVITGNNIRNYPSSAASLAAGDYLDRAKTYIGQNSHPLKDWAAITLNGDFSANGTYPPEYKIDGNTVYLRGGVIPKTSTSDRETIGSIGNGNAFPSILTFVGFVKGSNAAAGSGMFSVDPAGVISLSYFTGTDTYTYFLHGTYEAV